MKIVKFDGWDELEAGTSGCTWSATAASGTRHSQSDDARPDRMNHSPFKHSTMVSIPPPGAREQYDAARHRAAIVDRSDCGRIVVSGKDRASYLQGLLTNDIAALSPGDGCYTAYLTPQGRMISDLWIYELGDEMLIVLSRLMKDRVLTRLDQSIFAEDVQLRDASDTATSVAVVGPAAAEILGSVLTDLPADGLPCSGSMEIRRRVSTISWRSC